MEVKKLHNREVKLVKVQWSEAQEDATWETEDKTRASYRFLEGISSISFPRNVMHTCFHPFLGISSRSYLRSLGRSQWM